MPRPVSTARPAAPSVLAVVGATATGKSELALDLAQSFGGEIVNADASQFYRGMDIGTAKVPVAQRRGIAHHQLDVLEIVDEASLAGYQQAARADISAVLARGALPIVVGGSGLYLRALLEELQIPPTDPRVRQQWEERLQQHGVEWLHERLQRHDPVAAARIEPRNGRRLVRALEVIELTGQPFSATLPTGAPIWPTLTLGLRAERAVLDQRIERRVSAMWDAGLVAEVAALDAAGLRNGKTAARAIGYAQVLPLLDGQIDADQARQAVVAATRRLVRRQEAWFRRDRRIHWLDVDRSAHGGPGGLSAAASDLLAQRWGG